jgi:hypothetical protein
MVGMYGGQSNQTSNTSIKKWHTITTTINGIRFTNVITSSSRKEAFTEALGRTVGWVEFGDSKSKQTVVKVYIWTLCFFMTAVYFRTKRYFRKFFLSLIFPKFPNFKQILHLLSL